MKYLVLLSCLLFNSSLFPVGFVAGTLVKTEWNYTPIEQVQRGTRVFCYDNDISPHFSFVMQAIKRQTESIIQITCAEESIFAAPDHKFLLASNKWVEASTLKSGDKLVTMHGPLEVNNVEVIEENAETYDLAIENYETFFISTYDILVHNMEMAIIPAVYYLGGVTLAGAVKVTAYTGGAIAAAWAVDQIKNNVNNMIDKKWRRPHTGLPKWGDPIYCDNQSTVGEGGKVEIPEGTYGYIAGPDGPMTPAEYKNYYESMHDTIDFSRSQYYPIITIELLYSHSFL